MSAQESKSETVGFRLSPQQEWLLALDSPAVVQCAAVLAGPIREADLRAALEATIARYEILRTTFPRQAGVRGRSQAIHDSLAPEWSVEPDGSTGDPRDPAWLSTVLAGEAERGFDLEQGPLLRALLVGPAQERSLLVLSAHAACADTASLLLVLDELAKTYSGGSEPDEPVQYADYAEWRHELITGEDDEAADGRAFWRQDAEGRPAAERLLFASADAPSGRRAAIAIPFDAGEVARLVEAAAAAGVGAAVFLEACWHALLARLTGVGELLLAGWCDGRAQPDLQRAVGPYAQPVPIRSRIESETSFAEILDQVGRARAAAASRQDLAAADDLGALCADAAGGFVHLELEPPASPVLEIAAINPGPDTGLLLALRTSGEDLSAELWHDPGVHGEADSADLAGRFRTLVASAVSNPPNRSRGSR